MTLRQRRKPILSVETVRDFDAFVKVEQDYKQPTTTGGTSNLFHETSIRHYFFFSFDHHHPCRFCSEYHSYRYISKQYIKI